MKAIYVGKNVKGSSMYLVAEQIADRVEGVDVVESTSKLAHYKFVLNMVLEDTAKIVTMKRFTGVKTIRNFLACNWEELDTCLRGSVLMHSLENGLVVHSKYSHDSVMTYAKRYFNASTLSVLMRKIRFVPYGVSNEFEVSDKPATNWIVPYNRVNHTQKNLKLHSEISHKFSSVCALRGLPYNHKMVLLDGYGSFGSEDKSLLAYETSKQPETRQGYLDFISDRGSFLCTSNFESFGIYYLELLCSGTVGVFLDKKWVRDLLPGYPLIARGREEAIELMLRVSSDHSLRSEVISKVVPFIKERYNLDLFATEVMLDD